MKHLLEGLKQFQKGYYSEHHDLFEQLAHGQKPRALFITCSDSRVDPNLILQAEPGELFVLRNAGNIVPPYGAANGGEGAAVEYALAALDIRQIVVCGHSNCGAMKGLLKMDKLAEKMPLVHDWLRHAEATRRVIKENYAHCRDADLLSISTAENVLSQLENLRTYPVVRAKLGRGELSLHGWIYNIETGEVLAYDPELHDFTIPTTSLPAPDLGYMLCQTCSITDDRPIRPPSSNIRPDGSTGRELRPTNMPGRSRLSQDQAERIYRGSRR